jgi:dolichol-phosphate mannosyltransferase
MDETQAAQLIVALPAYNEEGSIELLLDSLCTVLGKLPVLSRIIVVDDGSTDATAARVLAFRGCPVSLVEHDRNRGLHEAVRTGMLEGLRAARPDGVIVTMDADNTHHPDLIPRMLEEISRGADLVIASRFAPGGRMMGASFMRRVYSYGARAILSLRFPAPGVRDYTCGYRAYRAAILQRAFDRWGDEFIRFPGFSCMLDILVRLRSLGARIAEVPLVLRYDRKVGPSKMRVFRTIANTLRVAALRE